MKQILTLLMLIMAFSCFAQKRSYVQIGPVAYFNTGGGTGLLGGAVGAGSSIGHSGAGINVELLSRNKQFILPVYADVRFYFSNKTTSTYVTLQPGYNFRNSQEPIKPYSSTKDKGGVYLGAGVGYFAFGDKATGINLQLKYIFLQDRFLSTSVLPDNSVRKEVLNTHEGFISLGAFMVF